MSETETVTATETVTSGKKTSHFEGTIENFYGRPLAKNQFKEGFTPVTSLDYKGSYDEYTSYDAVPADEKLKEADMLDVVNNLRKANARQKAMQAALDAAGVIKPTLETDDEMKISNIVKSLLASKKQNYTEERARELAKQMLGLG